MKARTIEVVAKQSEQNSGLIAFIRGLFPDYEIRIVPASSRVEDGPVRTEEPPDWTGEIK